MERSDEHRQQLSEALLGKPKSEEHKAALRKPHKPFERTEEHKRRISEALKGRIKSDEVREKISAAKTGVAVHTEEGKRRMSETRSGENSPMFGRIYTEEQKRHLKEVNTGRSGLLKKYGISVEEYASQIAAGNRWCFFRKHFAPMGEFPPSSRKTNVCSGCNSEYHRRSSLKKNFNVDHTWYEKKLAEQGGGCAICGSTTVHRGKKHLAIDHNHATGQLRGILCGRCNQCIERLEAVPNWCALATAYLVSYAIPSAAQTV